ncbi:hypothetical protein BIV57_01860 [Mangrovactinospora gilvigrisea]|uniref:Protein kinase domain-containing protein n=1 Tax=Mangrovactinospora gilvigrisea TaxID=1428644 RepID=A0A1J7BKQ5_9ACTN|nr:hypothetical protein [Mangrovactinospora gilvigrisea]OIV39255.1 hypothetical protein BIV57_01860 [Mangrovactinospora gilvigrisea]
METRRDPGRYRLTGAAVPRGDGLSGAVAFDAERECEVVITRVPLPEVVSGTLLADEWAQRVAGRGRGRRRAPDAAALPAGSVSGTVGFRALAAARDAAEQPEHRNLVRVFDVFQESGSVQVVSELVSGAEPLGALLEREGPLTPYRAAEVAADLLEALRAVHAGGRVHRNLSPWTVLVCADGTAMLGGAAEGAAQEATCGGGGVRVGPPPAEDGDGGTGPRWGVVEARDREARMGEVGPCAERWSPEQCGPALSAATPERSGAGPQGASGVGFAKGEPGWPPPVAGPETDLWALGVLVFRAVHGRAPFPEEDVERLLRAVRERRGVPRPEPGRPDRLLALRPVVAALLSVDPARRPSAEELRERLLELVARSPQPDAAEPGAWAGAGAGGDRLPVPRARGTVQVRPKGRKNVPAPRGGSRRGDGGRGRRAAGADRSGGRRSGLVTGVLLVLLVLVLVAAGLAAAVFLLPRSGSAKGAPGPVPIQVPSTRQATVEQQSPTRAAPVPDPSLY